MSPTTVFLKSIPSNKAARLTDVRMVRGMVADSMCSIPASGGPCQLPSTPGLLRKISQAIPAARTPRALCCCCFVVPGGPRQLPGTPSFLQEFRKGRGSPVARTPRTEFAQRLVCAPSLRPQGGPTARLRKKACDKEFGRQKEICLSNPILNPM